MKVVTTGYQTGQEMIDQIKQRLFFLRKYFVIPVISTEIEAIPYDISLKIAVRIDLGTLTLANSIVHDDYLTGVELCLMKIEDKIKAQKDILARRYRDCLTQSFLDSSKPTTIISTRVENRSINEYDEEEAIMFMELNGLSFLVYQDVSSKKLAAVFREIDGNCTRYDF